MTGRPARRPRRRLLLIARERVRRWRAALGRRRRPPQPTVALGSVQRRLELFLAALYGRPVEIHAAEAAPPRALWWRMLDRLDRPQHLRGGAALATSGGRTIRLPPVLDARAGAREAIGRFQLLAIGQAERLARGSARRAPREEERRLEHDLYALSESLAIDAAIARAVPGLRDALRAARAEALAARPPLESLTAAERDVEGLVRAMLTVDPAAAPVELPVAATPEDSARWAEAMARELGSTRRRYRGIAPVAHWGELRAEADGAEPFAAPLGGSPGARLPTPSAAVGGGHIAGDDAPEAGGDTGLSERDSTDARELADDRYGNIEALAADGVQGATAPVAPEVDPVVEAVAGIPYPEWDTSAGEYRPRATMVRVVAAADTDDAWSTSALARYAAPTRRVRAEFERFRARRLRLAQQKDGDELDLAAVVRGVVDRRTGHPPDERQYTAVRRARRGLAITLLADVSGSTDAPVTGALTVIDVERVALLMASEALDALGDRYAILAFSSHGARDVRIATAKSFAEANGAAVRARISSLAPGGYTRLGAAVRHAAALLAREPAGHRLLLVLSDGKPHDYDHYQGDFAVEDSRQAVMEARALGIHPFCIAIDAEGPEYLPHLFGPSGHTIVRQPERLPEVLLAVVRQLLRQA